MAQNENEITTVNPNKNHENKLEKKEHEQKNNLCGTENEVELTWIWMSFEPLGVLYSLVPLVWMYVNYVWLWTCMLSVMI